MGGDCLNTGCVPSKALIKTGEGRLADQERGRSTASASEVEVDFADVMERVQRVIRAIEPHDSAERYSALGVECCSGDAKITSPWTVEVDGKVLTTRSHRHRRRARADRAADPGIESGRRAHLRQLVGLRELPPRLLVLGGGPIGCELAQAFAPPRARRVTQVEMLPRLLATRGCGGVGRRVRSRFVEEGIDVRLAHNRR
jgi:pyruvate/2-oxoglutarate dehydrogenase complex dihydrolipoamide dehydrogenase (E3) component